MSSMFVLMLASALTTSALAGPHFIARRADIKVEDISVAMTDVERREIHGQCEAACGEGVDSSCIPQCEIEIYTCRNHASHTDEHKQCNDDIMKKYSEFGAQWDAQHFIAKLASSTLSEADRRVIHGECEAACGNGVDSSCVPQCEIEMYTCRSYASHTDEHKKCNDDVIKKYTAFGSNWDATHSEKYTLSKISMHSASDASLKLSVLGQCKATCGSGVDSSCVPKCQTEMFQCMDHDRLTASANHKECQDKIVKKYKAFASEWDATHLFVARRVVTTAEHKSINSQCQAACGDGVDSSCVPKFEIAMYACLDHASHTDERAQCNDKALEQARQFGANWDTHRLLARRKHHIMTASERKATHFQCKATCGTGVDSSCVPECETEMFACIDHEDPAERKQCSDEVLEKYQKFAANWHLQIKKAKL